jgi:hypothetical protein
VNHVQSPKSTALADSVKLYIRGLECKIVRDLWQQYAHGVNGEEPLREKERSGKMWRKDPIDPKTGKAGSTFRDFWSKRRPICLFIEMRIAMGDSEAVAVETCRAITNDHLTKNGCPTWNVLSPLLRGVLDQDISAVTTCQKICKENRAMNDRQISGTVGEQIPNTTALPGFHIHGPESRTVHDIWHEYAHGINGQEPLREKERRGKKWRQGSINPKTGKQGSALRQLWCRRRPIYLFIEMRIAMGDSEAVAVETCQEIVNNFLTRNGCPDWTVLSPLLNGVFRQEKKAVTTCQQIFNKYLNRNGRPISGVVDPRQQRSPLCIELTQQTANEVN